MPAGQVQDLFYFNQQSPEQYIKSVPNKTSIYLNPTSPDEIKKIINSLNSKKSSGVDGINAIIKYEICEPISTLINMSLEKGIVPDCMKTAKVVPIYRSKQKDQFTNYRPISLLPTISNFLEKIIHKRIYGFIEKKNTMQQQIWLSTQSLHNKRLNGIHI